MKSSELTPQKAHSLEIEKYIESYGKIISTSELQALPKHDQFMELCTSQELNNEYNAVSNGYDYLINKFYTDLKHFHERSTLLFQSGKQDFDVKFNENIIYGHNADNPDQKPLSCSHSDKYYNIMHIFFQYLAIKNENFKFEQNPGLFFSIGKKSYSAYSMANISKYFQISAYVNGQAKQLDFYKEDSSAIKTPIKDTFKALDDYMNGIKLLLNRDIRDEGSMCETIRDSEPYTQAMVCIQHNNVVVNANAPMNYKNCYAIMQWINVHPEICGNYTELTIEDL
ncbi:hypothetical protein [Candidatus Bandiella numerosa]|uniref:hypothetical protein n=1 Tax=Candidatus Bandiella numerosa TaxID=2570586 RepID=UPI001F209331|nr:hypothetical protein [Candidatus Bandiella numerosa]